MDSHNFGVPRLGMPPLVFSEALHGMCAGCGASHDFVAAPGGFSGYASTGCPTSWPSRRERQAAPPARSLRQRDSTRLQADRFLSQGAGSREQAGATSHTSRTQRGSG